MGLFQYNALYEALHPFQGIEYPGINPFQMLEVLSAPCSPINPAPYTIVSSMGRCGLLNCASLAALLREETSPDNTS